MVVNVLIFGTLYYLQDLLSSNMDELNHAALVKLYGLLYYIAFVALGDL